MDNYNSKTISANFVKMFFANMFLTCGFYMVTSLLPVYATDVLQMDKNQAGLIVGTLAISSVISRLISGVILDRIPRMTLYIPATIIFSLCFGLYAVATTFLLLIFVRFIHGFAWGAVSTSTSTIISDIVPKKTRGKGIGYFGLSMTFAMAIGPAIGAYLIDYTSFSFIFAFCLIISLLAVVISSSVKPPVTEKNIKPILISAFIEKRVLGISFIQFLFGVVYSGIMAYPILYGIENNIAVGVKWFFPILAISIAASRSISGNIFDKKGATVVLLCGFTSLSIGLMLLSISKGDILFLISSTLIGIGAGFIMPSLMAMTVNVVFPNRRGVANATTLTFFDTGIGLGAMFLGYMAKYVGYSNMYFISGIITFLPLFWYLLFERKKYLKMKEEIS